MILKNIYNFRYKILSFSSKHLIFVESVDLIQMDISFSRCYEMQFKSNMCDHLIKRNLEIKLIEIIQYIDRVLNRSKVLN